jgi:hypothetical protein
MGPTTTTRMDPVEGRLHLRRWEDQVNIIITIPLLRLRTILVIRIRIRIHMGLDIIRILREVRHRG